MAEFEPGDIRNLPIWDSCPWAGKLSAEYSVRLGELVPALGQILAIVCVEPNGDVLHCDCRALPEHMMDWERVGKPMLSNLVGARFYKRNPDAAKLHRAVAEYTMTGVAKVLPLKRAIQLAEELHSMEPWQQPPVFEQFLRSASPS